MPVEAYSFVVDASAFLVSVLALAPGSPISYCDHLSQLMVAIYAYANYIRNTRVIQPSDCAISPRCLEQAPSII